jgi:cold shock CspA family protein
MSQKNKVGVVVSWNAQRAFGLIRVGDPSSLERYFLHVSKIRSGTATPKPGMRVSFEVSPKPVKEGQLLQAMNADIDVHSIQPLSNDGGAQ